MNNHRVQKFTRDGSDPLIYNWVTTIGTFGMDDPGELLNPASVAVDVDDNLFVVDTFNHRIQKFAPVEEAAPLRAVGHAAMERKTRESRGQRSGAKRRRDASGRKRDRKRHRKRRRNRVRDRRRPAERS
jgi:hypothetical protein